jgi:Zn-dependent M28 family amino/carboxypeptidase
MRASRVSAAICASLLLAACAPARRMAPPSTDIDEDAYRKQLSTLASAEFEGRRPGTDGETRTVAYLVAEFRRLKLKPVSGDSYLQSVPMIEFTPDTAPALSMSGRGPVITLSAGRDMVIRSSREQAQVNLQGSDLVFAGYGIAAPEYGRDDFAGLDLHGKTVIVFSGDPGPLRTSPPAPALKLHMPGYFGRADYKIEEAARRGASGVLLIHDADATGMSWDAINNEAGGPHLQRVRPDGAPPRPELEGWLSADAGRALFAAAGLDFEASRAAAAAGGFKAMALGLRADAMIRQSIRRFTSANVIGVLPGARYKAEYIIYTAHWDQLGVRTTPTRTAVFAGAVDNASGVAGLLQVARSFSRTMPKPGRSIVFIATTGGEATLAGSAYYVENPLFALQDTVADLNLDTLHIGGPTRDVTVFGFGQSELEGYVRSAAALQGRELHADPDPKLGTFYRSDNFSFAAHGVPALYAIGGTDDAARGPQWGRSQLEDYVHHRYHRPDDVYSPDWDLRGTADDLRLYYRIGLMLAQGGRYPNWNRSSEFREGNAQDRGG